MHTSTVVDVIPTKVRHLLVLTRMENKIVPRDSDIAMLNDLSDKGLSIILFGYASDVIPPTEAVDAIDKYHHPIHDTLIFEDRRRVERYIAVQRDVRYVIDRRNPMAYGSRQLYI